MNIVSPFGRISRRGYLAVAVPLLVVILALGWTIRYFTSELPGPISTVGGTPQLRWLLLAGTANVLLQWGLFCAAVKRLHDVRWSGVFALPLLWSYPRAALAVIFPLIDAGMSGRGDLAVYYRAVVHAEAGFQLYGLALLILLAIVPGRKPHLDATGAVTA